mmetsp:Transcript_6471/g.25094  ORF Transcript_6471/g.25094 Transcript_6471/m.25094 type:complete len:278 (-) Transcript_6471:1707-2540(-)
MPSPIPSAAAGFPALTLVLFCLPMDPSTRVTSTLDAIAKFLVPTATFSTLTGTGGRLEDGALSLAFCDSCSFANDLLVRSAGPAPNPVLAAGLACSPATSILSISFSTSATVGVLPLAIVPVTPRRPSLALAAAAAAALAFSSAALISSTFFERSSDALSSVWTLSTRSKHSMMSPGFQSPHSGSAPTPHSSPVSTFFTLSLILRSEPTLPRYISLFLRITRRFAPIVSCPSSTSEPATLALPPPKTALHSALPTNTSSLTPESLPSIAALTSSTRP